MSGYESGEQTSGRRTRFVSYSGLVTTITGIKFMRSGPNNRRSRGRGNSGRGNRPQRSNNFDSNGPDIKVRGSAQQVVEKYQALAREAATAGDPVKAENYFQHAEHYYRSISTNGSADNKQGQQQRENHRNNQDNGKDHQKAANEIPKDKVNGLENEPLSSASSDPQEKDGDEVTEISNGFAEIEVADQIASETLKVDDDSNPKALADETEEPTHA